MNQTQLKGTAYPVVAPLFFQPVQQAEVEESDNEIVDILDPDLDLLTEADDEVIDFEDGLADEQKITMKVDDQTPGGEITLSDDFERAFASGGTQKIPEPDKEELMIDSSLFEDQSISASSPSGRGAGRLEIPEELADISDLAPPAATDASPAFGVKAALDDRNRELVDDLNLDDLELDDLKLSFDDPKNEESVSMVKQKKPDLLSLDDIDLSDGLDIAPSQPSSQFMDDDLNFDFDLGGVVEKKEEKPKKAPDDFPDFTLSLD
jgi:hypothetical protein